MQYYAGKGGKLVTSHPKFDHQDSGVGTDRIRYFATGPDLTGFEFNIRFTGFYRNRNRFLGGFCSKPDSNRIYAYKRQFGFVRFMVPELSFNSYDINYCTSHCVNCKVKQDDQGIVNL